MDIYIARGEDRNGPYSEDAIRQFLADGELDGTELAWHEGLNGWVNVKDLVEGAATADTPEAIELKRTKVFISYRREDCQGSADFLYSLLEGHFGPGNVFFDVDSIDPGRNYVEYLDEQVSRCSVLLALIGRRWVTMENKAGEKRLFDENDFVRKEITSAMDQGITVIPLLVERAEMPTPSMLPEELHKFCDQQAAQVRPGRDFKKDVNDLIKKFESMGMVQEPKALFEKPLFNPDIEDHVKIEAAVRKELKKPTGELTKADLGKIEILRLDHNNLTDLSAFTLYDQSIGMLFAGLKRLDLRHNQITEIGDLACLQQLTELRLENNPNLMEQWFEIIHGNIPNCTILSDFKLTVDESKAFIESAIREELKKPTGELTTSDLEKVKMLCLDHNNLTDVTALAGLTQLKRLDLQHNQITDVSALAELTQLTLLGLNNNNIADVSALEKLTQLTGLALQCNPKVTKAEIEKLQQALPKCKISPEPRI